MENCKSTPASSVFHTSCSNAQAHIPSEPSVLHNTGLAAGMEQRTCRQEQELHEALASLPHALLSRPPPHQHCPPPAWHRNNSEGLQYNRLSSLGAGHNSTRRALANLHLELALLSLTAGILIVWVMLLVSPMRSVLNLHRKVRPLLGESAFVQQTPSEQRKSVQCQ